MKRRVFRHIFGVVFSLLSFGFCSQTDSSMFSTMYSTFEYIPDAFFKNPLFNFLDRYPRLELLNYKSAEIENEAEELIKLHLTINNNSFSLWATDEADDNAYGFFGKQWKGKNDEVYLALALTSSDHCCEELLRFATYKYQDNEWKPLKIETYPFKWKDFILEIKKKRCFKKILKDTPPYSVILLDDRMFTFYISVESIDLGYENGALFLDEYSNSIGSIELKFDAVSASFYWEKDFPE